MTISGVNTADILANLSGESQAGNLQTQIGVRMLKKAQDQITQEGQAMIQMLVQAGSVTNPPDHLDVLA